MKTTWKIMAMLALVTALGVAAGVATEATAAPVRDQYIGGGGGVDGCDSSPVAVGDPNYDGACDEPEALDTSPEVAKTIEGVASRCRTVEEHITYRASISGVVIWQYVQQVEWCWGGGLIRYVNRIRFVRFSITGGIYWDFKGHIASSCAAWADYSPCSETAGRPTAYIATQGKFQTITCGVKLFCITKTPGMWLAINGFGKVTGFGKL